MTAPAPAAMATAMAAAPATGALFDIVLVLHVAAALVALGTVAASGIAAGRVLRPGGEVPAGVRRYFAPGVNWAGRALHAVPLLGLALVALSGGAYGFDDGWVLAGVGLWAAAAALAEGVLWPAERRVQAALAGSAPPGSAPPGSVPPGSVSVAGRRACVRLCGTAVGIEAVLIAAMVVMVARP